MAYLGMINRVNVKDSARYDSAPKQNISFTGSIKQDELSDEEYKKLREKIEEKLKQRPELQKYVKQDGMNKNNILLADKIFSDERLLNSPDFMKKANNIIRYTRTPEEAQIKCGLIDKLLSDENLFNSSGFIKNAAGIIDDVSTPEQAQLAVKIFSDERLLESSNFAGEANNIIYHADTPEKAQLADRVLFDERLSDIPDFMTNMSIMFCNGITPEAAQVKCDLLDKFLSDERLYSNPDFMKTMGQMVYNIETDEEARVKCDLLDKFLSDEKLLNNTYFVEQIGQIICRARTAEEAQIKCTLVDKITSDEKSFNDSEFMKTAGSILLFTNTPEQAQLADKILFDKRLNNNPSFMKKATEIIICTDCPKVFQAKCDLIDKILSDERLFNNPHFMEQVGSMVRHTKTPEQTQAKCDLIDKILSDEKPSDNPEFMKTAGSLLCCVRTPEQVRLADKILSDEKLFNNSDFIHPAIAMINSAFTPERAQVADKILSREELFNNPDFMQQAECIVKVQTPKEAQLRCDLIDSYANDKEYGITLDQLFILLFGKPEITYGDIKRLNNTIGKDKASRLSEDDTVMAVKLLPLYKKQNINELPLVQKGALLRDLVASDSDLFEENKNLHELFPVLPKNQDEYCELLPFIVRSIGIETNALSCEEIENFNASQSALGNALKNISDEEFNNLDIKQEYSKDDFISDVLDKVKDLTPKERQKVYDYFGFELYSNEKNEKTHFSIAGYPTNLNNGKKLAQITDPKTKAVVEDLRENVIHFSEDNRITCNNEQIETLLNEIAASLPELRPMIGKTQHGTHEFDVMQHSLKVMKKIVENPEFDELNDSDKKIMLLASLLHDITKKEGSADKTHENEGAFNSFFIAKKFNLTQEEEIKLHTLIKNHEWLKRVNGSGNEEELTENIQSTAYDLRHDNLFDMSLIFTHADLMAVKKDDSFHDTRNGKGRKDFRGNVRSFGESADYYAIMIKKAINELKKSQPVLPTTKLPSSNEIKSRITNVNPDGSTNIKGVYKDKNGLVIIKYNEVEDWEAIGLSKGSISRGIMAKTDRGDTVNTGNIKFMAHGLDYANHLVKFDAFSSIVSDALLSVSYMERPESKYRLFRPQGVLLDVDTKHIHGGGKTDLGSGCGKNIQTFKDEYIFGADRESDRLFISNLIKKATGMNNSEYIKFVEENSNKSLNEIEPVELREKLIKAFASIKSHIRAGGREYNEMYISNPKPIGVFAYNTDIDGTVDNPVDFLDDDKVQERTDFLKDYAAERNIPFIVFGD